MVRTLLPLWALVISLFSYGAQAVSSDAQNRLIAQQVAAQEAQNEILLADVRGLLIFEAQQDAGDVILKKADGRPFQIEGLTLIANYQADRDEGPVDSKPVPVEPIYVAADGERAVRIKAAQDLLCAMDNELCTTPIRMLTLEFVHDGIRYRVVAIPR